MIHPVIAKIIHLLPERFVTYASKKLVDRYLNKYANIHVSGAEHLEKMRTPTLFVCNHLSNADGLVLNRVLRLADPTFVAGVKLSENSVTNIGMNVVKTTHIVPDSADHEGLKKIIRLVKSGENILIFPEGTRSRTGSMIKAKKGILLIARMTGAPIVPIGIYGSEQLLPINHKGDMSGEVFHHASVHVHIGEQFNLTKKDKDQDKKTYEEMATKYIMERIARLLPTEYQGVYAK